MHGIDVDLLSEFLWSAREELASLEQSLVACDKQGATPDSIAAIYRSMHSLKGAAGLVRLVVLEQAAHVGEQLLLPCRSDAALLNGDLVSAMLAFADGAKHNLATIERQQCEDPAAFAVFLKATSSAGAPPPLAPAAPSAPPVAAATPAKPKPPAASPASPTPASAPAPAVPTAPAEPRAEAAAHAEIADTAVRVDLSLLDNIMNLVGELVLARNQLLQAAGRYDDPMLAASGQAINGVTTSLQSHIMRTRMQPIGTVFAKFPRVVRDLAKQLDKRIELDISGKETELDRTILEAMRDPFTHILRNSCDHGIETPAARLAAGKSEHGTIRVRAFHEGGQVVVEVRDDGKGIDAAKVRAKAQAMGVITQIQAARMSEAESLMLICHPGLSTAEQVTAISGRGVGMDVVRSNIEKVGGSLELSSTVGKGSTVRIKIPLTLAIIPALMVSCAGRLYGIPQVNLLELVGVECAALNQGLETVRGVEVYRLRERLLTIVRMEDVLGVPRRVHEADAMLFIVVVAAGDQPFGLVVDDILDTEEIVVKPLSRHLAALTWFAGATIRGDGGVALILDIPGAARRAGISGPGSGGNGNAPHAAQSLHAEHSEFLVFTLGNREHFAVPLADVARIDQCLAGDLTTVNGTRVICRNGTLVPAIDIERFTRAQAMPPCAADTPIYAILLKHAQVAVVARELIDNVTIDTSSVLSDRTVVGSSVVTGLTVVAELPTALIDTHALTALAFPIAARPGHAVAAATALASPPANASPAASAAQHILYCEDAQFFQNVVSGYLSDAGYQVTICANGREGLRAIADNPQRFSMILTDIEMPEMDGWEFIAAVRAHPALKEIPIMTLTSLSDDVARQRSLHCGANRHAVKIDRDALVAAVSELISAGAVS